MHTNKKKTRKEWSACEEINIKNKIKMSELIKLRKDIEKQNMGNS